MGLGCTRTGANAISAAETTCWAADTSAARTACDAEIAAGATSTPAGVTACETMGQACLTCPAGCQAAIDTMYADCDGEDGWDAYKPEAKSNSERAGCGAAATSTPVLFVLTAAVSSHSSPTQSREPREPAAQNST
jgi:hypothetical protein